MTRTSATGSDRPRRSGFTLTELLVVIAVLGFAGAAVVVALTDPRPSVLAEAERFAAVLTRAREEAALTNRAFEVRADPQGYAFRVRRRGVWTPIEQAPFDPRAWAADTTVVVESAGRAERSGAGAVVFDPTGFTEPVAVTLYRDRAGARVVVDASGEVKVDATR